MKKKLIISMLCIVLSLNLVACGLTDNNQTSGDMPVDSVEYESSNVVYTDVSDMEEVSSEDNEQDKEREYIVSLAVSIDEMSVNETGGEWGICGENLSWYCQNFEDYGDILVIRGAGEMSDYSIGGTHIGYGGIVDVEDVTSPWASYANTINWIIIEDGCTSIGKGAFADCRLAGGVIIPDSVTKIGEYAFHGCENLFNIIIPNSVTVIDKNAFCYCKGLTNILIPEKVTIIGDWAFKECDSLTSMTIPESVTTIGEEAFANCDNLKEVIILNENINIAPNAFENTTIIINNEGNNLSFQEEGSGNCGDNLTWCYGNGSLVISGTGEMDDWEYNSDSLPWANVKEDIKDIVIEDGCTSIGASAFCGCSTISSITIPSSVTTIGEKAFYGCESLTSITIPEGVANIEPMTFYQCYKLSNITIPSSVTTIGEKAFYGCNSLSDIVIPDSVFAIGEDAFYLCEELTSVTLSNNITTIEEGTFGSCKKLTGIIIPEGVTSIGEKAFYGCESLEARRIMIPESVINIESGAFGGFDIHRLYIPNENAKISYDIVADEQTIVCGDIEYLRNGNSYISMNQLEHYIDENGEHGFEYITYIKH